MALEHLGPKVTETVTPEPDSVMECKDTKYNAFTNNLFSP